MSFDESMRLSRVHPIVDEALRCRHVVRGKEGVASFHPLDLHLTIAISRCVHQAHSISTVITPRWTVEIKRRLIESTFHKMLPRTPGE